MRVGPAFTAVLQSTDLRRAVHMWRQETARRCVVLRWQALMHAIHGNTPVVRSDSEHGEGSGIQLPPLVGGHQLDPEAVPFTPGQVWAAADGPEGGINSEGVEGQESAARHYNGVSSVCGPMCPDEHRVTKDNTRAARLIPHKSHKAKYAYICNWCLKHFEQTPPQKGRSRIRAPSAMATGSR